MMLNMVGIACGAWLRKSAALALHAQAASLEEALRGLARTNPEILAGRELVNAADQRIRATPALFLPTVVVTTDVGVDNVSTPARRNVSSDPF